MAAIFLDAGAMSARLDVETPVNAGDGQGGVIPGFAPVTTLWARVEPLSMNDEERADEAKSAVTHRIIVRYRDDLRAGMRFRNGSRLFMIVALGDPDETRRYIDCRCREEIR